MAVLVATILVFNVVVDDYLSGRFVSRLLIAISITALARRRRVARHHHPQHRSLGRRHASAWRRTSRPSCSPTTAGCLRRSRSRFAVAIGAVLGLVNGVLVAVAKVPSIIVTLGTLSIFRSVLTSHAGGKTISTGSLPDVARRSAPEHRVQHRRLRGAHDVRARPLVIVVAAAPHPAVHAEPAGTSTPSVRTPMPHVRPASTIAACEIAAFVACGALAGLAGFLYVGRFGTINVTAGSGLELAAIAAAVVGGVSTLGGSGTIMGAFLGAVLIAVLDQSLVRVEQISEFWRDAILGALILARRAARRRRSADGCGSRPGPKRRSTKRGRSSMASWARRYTWELLLLRDPAGTIVFNITQSSGYLGVDNFVNLFQLHIEKVIVVVTMTFVIIAGEIDLSVASVMAWSASVLGRPRTSTMSPLPWRSWPRWSRPRLPV